MQCKLAPAEATWVEDSHHGQGRHAPACTFCPSRFRAGVLANGLARTRPRTGHAWDPPAPCHWSVWTVRAAVGRLAPSGAFWGCSAMGRRGRTPVVSIRYLHLSDSESESSVVCWTTEPQVTRRSNSRLSRLFIRVYFLTLHHGRVSLVGRMQLQTVSPQIRHVALCVRVAKWTLVSGRITGVEAIWGIDSDCARSVGEPRVVLLVQIGTPFGDAQTTHSRTSTLLRKASRTSDPTHPPITRSLSYQDTEAYLAVYVRVRETTGATNCNTRCNAWDGLCQVNA